MSSPSDNDQSGTPFIRHTGGYVTLPNEAVNDDRLSLRATGLLAWMLGRPPGWRFDSRRIAADRPEGRDAVQTAMRELVTCGYVRRTKHRRSDGSFVTVTEVAALPALMPPAPDSPGPGAPAPGNPAPVNPAPVSVLGVKTESQKETRARRAPSVPVTSWSGPDDALYAWAKEQRWTRQAVDEQVQAMKDWAISKDERKVDWDATLRNWIRRVGLPKHAAILQANGRPIPDSWR